MELGAKRSWAAAPKSCGPTPIPEESPKRLRGSGNLHMYTLRLPIYIPKRG